MRRDVLIERNLIRTVAPAPEAVAVARLIDRNPVDPGPQAGLAAEAMDGAEHPEKHFLGQVERFVSIPQKVHGELDDHPLVFADELGAGRFVPFGAPADKGRFTAADVRPADDTSLLHREFHYTSLDPDPDPKFPMQGTLSCYDNANVRRTIAVLTVLLVGLTAATLAYLVAARQRDYRAAVVRGDTALRDDQTFAAIEAYSGAIALRGDSMLAYLRRGETYRKRADRGDLEAAARDFRKAAALDPSATRPLEELGDVRYQLQQYDRAIDAYEQSVRLDDRSPRVTYKLALARYRLGSIDGALAALDQTIRLDDRMADAYYLLGICSRAKKRTADAVRAFEKAIALSPAMIPAREELADLYGELDRRSDQLDQLQVLVGLDRGRVERQVAVGLAHARARRWDAAVLTLGSALERTQDDPILYRAIGEVWLESAQARSDRVDLSKAREALERAAAGPGPSSDVLLLLARALIQENELDAAEHALEQATQRFPVAPQAFLAHAGVAERLSHFDNARRSLIQYEALISSDADFVAHAIRIASLSLRVGDAPTAAYWIRRGLDREPQNAQLAALENRVSAASDPSRPASRPQGN